MSRESKVERTTKETTIAVRVVIDGEGVSEISTGIPFFDHMLHLFARHGSFDLFIEAKGDVEVDSHHTVEDVGIVLGRTFKEALGNFEGLKRYGHAMVPMDESLAVVALDLSGRPAFVWKGELQGRIGLFDLQVVSEFFKAFAAEVKCAVHVNLVYGENLHHKVEAVFKAFGRALNDASAIGENIKGALSTKGML
ncbi:MAG: imidazoleglycerol-phosphate dehydratase HisB [Syntrophobacterales bacterium]|jgi:imidazoleglycerol-phosphate dehydratase|nr:imidazoleglycerol-phosphate dehydratase HisB [Syntrophobacterales bacterium]